MVTMSKMHAHNSVSKPLLIINQLLMIMSVARVAVADTPDCAYPCLPPPTSGANSYPPPPPAAGNAYSYPPPAFPGYPPPPGNNIPGYYAPPYSTYPAPPPPNPILPWFPWYYRHDNPITATSSSATVPRRVTCMGAILGGVMFPMFLQGLLLVL